MNERTSHAEWKTLAVEAQALAAKGELGQAIDAEHVAVHIPPGALIAHVPPGTREHIPLPQHASPIHDADVDPK